MIEELDYKVVIVALAAFISLSNLAYYIFNVLIGKTKPHFYTWLIWGLVTVIAALGQIVSGGGWGGYYTLLVAFNCFTIATLAFFKGEKNIVLFDKYCLVACLISIALWPLTKAPLLSVILVTLIDTVGFLPTLRKSYNKPHEENLISFMLYGLTYSMSIVALESYNFVTVFYPAVIATSALSLAIMLIIRRKILGYKVFT